MATERYRNLQIEILPPMATGVLGRQTICSAIVYQNGDVLFSLTMSVSYALGTREGEAPEDLACKLVRRHVHGLIDLGRFEPGGEYEVNRTERWIPDAADSTVREEETTFEILAAAQRMARVQASADENQWLDIEGFADALEIDSERLRADIAMMEIDGLIEAVGGEETGLTNGWISITSSGRNWLRTAQEAIDVTSDRDPDQNDRPDVDYEFDVALSFAGEQRAYVSEVATILRARGVRVFYDEFEAASLWGRDLAEYFDQVYRLRSRFAMLFVSEAYASKVWPTHEKRSALARALEQADEYILPVRFDDTDIPGLPPTVGHVDGNTQTPTNVADLLEAKLGGAGATTRPVTSEDGSQGSESPWHVDLAIAWGEEGEGRSRYGVRWDPSSGLGPMNPEDTALEGMGTAPVPAELELSDGIRVGHMRGRSLRFDFEGPARPVAARLHHGDDLHGPQSTGGGAEHHVEFRLSQLQGVE